MRFTEFDQSVTLSTDKQVCQSHLWAQETIKIHVKGNTFKNLSFSHRRNLNFKQVEYSRNVKPRYYIEFVQSPALNAYKQVCKAHLWAQETVSRHIESIIFKKPAFTCSRNLYFRQVYYSGNVKTTAFHRIWTKCHYNHYNYSQTGLPGSLVSTRNN